MAFHRHHDVDTDEENDDAIDPALRLRTVRTAASTIAESILDEQRVRRKKKRSLKIFRSKSKEKRRADAFDTGTPPSDSQPPASSHITGKRRNIYVNTPLSPPEVDVDGEPLVHFVRNKVRTTKYTPLTFVPKNLYEQFRRVANIYFLALVVIQVFPLFGAAGASISWLPLVFIISVTAVKDGIEDYRRALRDEEVNVSASTKLGNWKNVNQPTDPRSWFQKLLGLNPPGKVTKGVRKLRAREASSWNQIVLQKDGEVGDTMSDDRTAAIHEHGPSVSSVNLDSKSMMRWKEDPSEPTISYPPFPVDLPRPGNSTTGIHGKNGSLGDISEKSTIRSRKSFGVVDWGRQAPGTAQWERTLWKKLEVGDIVLLRDNDQVPADIVVMSTSDPEGMCYLETKNLDGETNLKPRRSLKATSSLQSEEDIEHASFVLDSEPPHANLYLYNGVLRFRDKLSGAEKLEPVTINELLLRGCIVRNTSWIIGLVVFTGADTKIMLNGGSTPSKRSKIERETNFNVVMNFVILALMCLASAIASGVIDGQTDTSKFFYESGSDPSSSQVVNAIITFASCLIAFQNIVPIALYISIEIVKTIQAYFISQDIDMFYAPLERACEPKTWNISDDLGQIEYIFSDKTGTLTQNVMEFQRCSVMGTPYGEGVTEAQRGSAMRTGSTLESPEAQTRRLKDLKQEMIAKMTRGFRNNWLQTEKLTLIAPKLVDDMLDTTSSQRGHIIAFYRALAVCHSVLPDRPDAQMQPYRVEYKAESPDEAALVAAARDVGFAFVSKANGCIDIEVLGELERYTLLRTLEFNSTRKRMSVVVRNPEGRLVLYTKGADSVIYARLASDQNAEIKAKTQKDMEDFANGGLRTLCIAYRYLSEEEYARWSQMYDAAASAVKDREEAIEAANEEIEHSLYILGATALEDKLQEGVPDAIEILHNAGIKLWILTGDKVQTAIEIGYSCNLLKQDMDVMIISATSPEEARAKIEAGLNKVSSVLGPPKWSSKSRGFIPGAQASFAIVIDGDTLRYALDSRLKLLFLNLATQCETVVCCRVSPSQKAQAVKLVKDGRNAMTLSIGDGANDVAMIQEANVGCGLLGLEGSQAAMSADYAFGQFRYLTKLLIVHGRWSYVRVANMHKNFFYKNVSWTFAMFWFLFYNSFDATYLYEYTFILLYSVVFTSLPVIALGAFDQDINAKAALAFPQLYVRGIRGFDYSRTKFWVYMADGLYQSAIMFFIPFFAWTLGPAVSWNGKGIDSLADFGTTIAAAAIFSANFYVGMNIYYWTVITWIVVVGSSLVMVIWIGIYSLFESPDFNYEVVVLYGSVTFWATVLLTLIIAIGPRFLFKFVRSAYFPQDRDIVREMWVKGDLKKRLGIRSRRETSQSVSEARTETAPMYHDRSISEISQAGYEPALTYSPGQKGLVPPGSDHSYYNEGWSDREGSSPAPPEFQYVVDGEPDEYTAIPAGAHLSPNFNTNPNRHSYNSDPDNHRLSYYSASEIPAPSPLPSPKYMYYGQDSAVGSGTTTPLAADMSRTPSANAYSPFRSNINLNPGSGAAAAVPRSSPPAPEAVEMRAVRSPPSAFPQQRMVGTVNSHASRARSASRTSTMRGSEASHYATASEGEQWDEDEDDGDDDATTINHGDYSTPHAL